MDKLTKIPALTLLVALSLSTIAAYYSIVGLTAIFAGAVIPVIIMGSILEVAKITTTVWLRTYWKQCGWLLKTYLVPAVIVLAFITSLGIFGFLSKAHIDQGVPSGDVAAKVALIDENIKTQRENIKANRDALSQLDAQVNNVMNKGDSEKSAVRSVQIRRQQVPERAKLQREIENYNKSIASLNQERAPIASQLRKVEAEVGPLKYIAAMIYGDNPDATILEKSVRWVIILIVLVFDPLAIALILAANQSKKWELEAQVPVIAELIFAAEKETLAEPIVITAEEPMPEFAEHEKFDFASHPYLFVKDTGFVTQTPEPQVKPEPDVLDTKTPWPTDWDAEAEPVADVITEPDAIPELITDVTTEHVTVPAEEYTELPGGYVDYRGKHMHIDVLKGMRPDLFTAKKQNTTPFGTRFPATAYTDGSVIRVDVYPHRIYRYNGAKWVAVTTDEAAGYTFGTPYIKYLVGKLDAGEYDISLVTASEKRQIEEYLTTTT